MRHARSAAVRWRVRPAERPRRLRRLLGIPALVLGLLWCLLAIDAAVLGSEPTVGRPYLVLGSPDERAALWRDPPYGSGDRSFRWGMSSNGDPGQGWHPDQARRLPEWLPLYRELDPDIVRIFAGWRYYQPDGPGTLSDDYYIDDLVGQFADAGYEVQVSLWNAPAWGVIGGPARWLGPAMYSSLPPLEFDSPDGPFCDFMSDLHERHPAITFWQIWNEPDWPHGKPGFVWNPLATRFWRGTAEQYGSLLSACSERVRSWGDGSFSSTGGITDPTYLDRVLSVPGAADVDVLDMHFAAGTGRPDPDEQLDRLLWQARAHKAVAASHGVASPRLSVSELSFAYSDEGARAQADFVAKVYATTNALGWDSLSWFMINPFHTFTYWDTGLTGFGEGWRPGPPRPSFHAYAFNKAVLDRAVAVGVSGDGTEVRSADFVTTDGEPIWAAWSPVGEGTVTWPPEAGPGVVYDHVGTPLQQIAPGETVLLRTTLSYFVPASWKIRDVVAEPSG